MPTNTSQRNFNTSSLTLNSVSQGKITSIRVNCGGAKINVFEPGDLCILYELGTTDFSIEIGLKGASSPTLGASGPLAITLGNGSALAVGQGDRESQCGKTTVSGQQEGMWEGTAEYWPSTTATTT